MNFNLRRLFLPVAATMLFAAAWARAEPAQDQIRALAAESRRAVPVAGAIYDERGWLDRFYAPRDFAPAWSGAGPALALELLERAPEHGLERAAYLPDALARQLREPDSAGAGREAGADAALTLAMLRYLADLHAGRTRVGFQPVTPDARAANFDPVAVLQRALAGQQLAAAVDAAAPQIAIYRRLKAALAHYRELAMQPWPSLPPLPAGRKRCAPGGACPGAQQIARSLALLGDMPAELAASQDERYGEPLAAAVKHFQDRHGLDADGVLGRQTLAALSVPPSARVRQIELSLERLRWLPDLPAGPVVAINLPSFRLWAFRTGNAGAQPALEMRVIVGKALRNQTPAFIGAMRHIEFNPYWNVPRSIERAEILPKLAQDPRYLERNNMELVGAGGKATGAVDAAALQALRAGTLRIRQRPGPDNALGAVKFALPNAMNIYLHSTPARALFERTRRDFSHGCIRLEDPAGLANFVLADQPEWPPEAIAAAMAPGPTRTVRLAAPMPVMIFYTTAIVDNEGRALFPADLYRQDEALERALAPRGGRPPGLVDTR